MKIIQIAIRSGVLLNRFPRTFITGLSTEDIIIFAAIEINLIFDKFCQVRGCNLLIHTQHFNIPQLNYFIYVLNFLISCKVTFADRRMNKIK